MRKASTTRRALAVCLAFLGIPACAGTTADRPTTSAHSATTVSRGLDLASLERTPELDELGVPPWSALRAEPVFAMGFEAPDEATPSYATPESDATKHQRWSDEVHTGRWAETGWLTGTSPSVPEVDGPNHRGYPTIQLQKLGRDTACTPCLVDLWTWLDVSLQPGQWFSLGTFALEPSDRWARVVTINVGSEGELDLFHVPRHGEGTRVYQTHEQYPMRRWVRVTTYLDLRPDHGVAAVWQDGKLASAATVEGGNGTMPQAHFGLYAPPDLLQGRVVNDDISFWRLRT